MSILKWCSRCAFPRSTSFCPNCGASTKEYEVCNCGRSTSPLDNFCGECGKRTNRKEEMRRE